MRHSEVRGGYSYEFGQYRLDPLERLLTKDGAPVPLSPKAFEVLLFFVRNNGKALSKDELMKAGWGDTFVEEANLTQTISVLRKALGEGLDERVYIETIPKHGYRFRVPVESKPVVIPLAPDDRRMDNRKRLLGLIGAALLLVVLCVLVLAHRLMTAPSELSVTPRFFPLVTDPGVRAISQLGSRQQKDRIRWRSQWTLAGFYQVARLANVHPGHEPERRLYSPVLVLRRSTYLFRSWR